MTHIENSTNDRSTETFANESQHNEKFKGTHFVYTFFISTNCCVIEIWTDFAGNLHQVDYF